MIDIVSNHDGLDIGLFDTQTNRAKNIIATQLGSLEYEPDLGIDLKYFLSEGFRFQNESFKSYLIKTLADRGISVASLDDTVASLYHEYIFNLSPDETSTGLIAR